VNGLTEIKKGSCEFVTIMSRNDVIFLYETWSKVDSNIDLQGYVSYNYYRKFQHRQGVAVYIKETIAKGVQIVRNHHDTLIWLKLDKSFLQFFRRCLYLWCILMG
jgi:exonuclease III